MKLIKLTNCNLVARVSDKDWNKVNKYNWYFAKSSNRTVGYCNTTYYVNKKRFQISLHRLVMGVKDPKVLVDHRNGDTLVCTRRNLRICTNRENMQNRTRLQCNNKSGFRNVSWDKSRGKWTVRVKHDGVNKYFGRFLSKYEAHEVAKSVRKKLFGRFAGL